jgi:Putative zinc-finger
MNPILQAVGHILSCKEASHYVSRAQDARLSAFARWKLEMHLKVCANCLRFEQQLRVMREALRRYKL